MAVDLSASITSPTGFTLDNGTLAGKGTVAQAADLLAPTPALGSVMLYDVASNMRGLGFRGNSNTLQAIAANFLILTPVSFAKSTIVELGIEVTTAAAAGNTARLGLYGRRSTSMAPGALLVDTGTLAVDSTGHKSASISVAVQVGALYWCAIASSAAPTLRASGTIAWLLGYQVGSGANNNYSLIRSFTYGALPSDESGQATYSLYTANPHICIWR